MSDPHHLRQWTYESFPYVTLSDDTFDHTTSGSWVAITFPTDDFDRYNLHSTVSNTHRIDLPFIGLYLVNGAVNFGANATGQRGVRIVNKAGTVLSAVIADATNVVA